MKDITKYRGIIPAFYACYAPDGSISTERVKALTRHLIAKGVKGVYVGGSSGECIYQHPDERKAVLEAVMSEAKGKITVIAHVACNNTADSVELAAHAEKCGVDAIASIPPIYFHLPNYAIADYWNAMSAAAPNTEFVIYNIPQLAGTALTMPLLQTMLKNPNVIAVKNSSMPTQDIQLFKDAGIQARGEDGFAVFNGPDEQFVSGRVMGADGGIGGTYQGGSIDAAANPVSLVMLVPVVLMLTVSTKTRNIYQGILVGLVTGTIVGLIAGLFTPTQVFSNDAANNAAIGFLIDGINNILPTCALVISVFGIMGILSDAGMLNLIAEKILNSKMAGTAKGAELVCMMGIAFTTILLGGVTSASILTFGPILNKIGAARNIHPYRRANLLDGTANSLPAIIPFMSVFVFIGSALTGLSPVVVAGGTIYGFVLFFVFLGAVLTGWGCQKEEET